MYNGYDEPYLGTYNPQDYYNMMLQVNPLQAERETKEACFNSGTSQYNPINQSGEGMAWHFSPVPETKLEEFYMRDIKRREDMEKIREKFMLEMEVKKFKDSIWYKIYKFFGGF